MYNIILLNKRNISILYFKGVDFINTSIGEKIRLLRKELRMTQAELAEPLMTKGMLSHVEKGKANLSMKNLKYIADKLNKPLSYFIDDEPKNNDGLIESLSEFPLNSLNKELKDIDKMIRLNIKNTARDKVYKLIARYDLSKNIIIHADVLMRLARVQNSLLLYEDARKSYEQVSDLYNSVKLYNLSSLALQELSEMLLSNFNYDDAISVINSSYLIYEMSPNIDPMYELDHLSSKLVYHTSKCNLRDMIDISKDLIFKSKELQIFGKISLALWINAIMSTLQLNEQSSIYAINQLRSYGFISENQEDIVLADILSARLHNNLGNIDLAKSVLSSLTIVDYDNSNSNILKFIHSFELGRVYLANMSSESAIEYFKASLDIVNHQSYISYDFIKIIVEFYYNIALIASKNPVEASADDFSCICSSIDDLYDNYKDNTSIIGIIVRSELAMLYKFLSYTLESMSDFKGAYGALSKANLYCKNSELL